MNVIVNTGPSSESCGDVPHAHPTAPGPCQRVQSASFRVPRRRGAACVGEGRGGEGLPCDGSDDVSVPGRGRSAFSLPSPRLPGLAGSSQVCGAAARSRPWARRPAVLGRG